MLSVITPACDHAANLTVLHQRLDAALAGQPDGWEWVIVDDHSGDATATVVATLAGGDPRVRGIRLARRVGWRGALIAGLDVAQGSHAVVMAGDLRHPPELIPELLAPARRGAEIVWGIRRTSPPGQADIVERAHASVLRYTAGIATAHLNGASFLIGRTAIDRLRQFPDRRLDPSIALASLALPSADVLYDAPPPTREPLLDRLGAMLTSATAFSDAPLRAGLAATVGVLGGGIVALLLAMLGVSIASLSPGWMLLLSGILLAGGLNLLLLVIIGEYVWRLVLESRRGLDAPIERRFGS